MIFEAIADLVDDEQSCAAEPADAFAQAPLALGLGQRGDDVGEGREVDAATGLHRFDAERHRQVRLAGAGRAENMKHLAAVDELELGEGQDRLQVLMQDEARRQPAAEALDQREQPDDPRYRRFVGEDHLELSEVGLRLAARRRLETDFERQRRRRTDGAQEVGDRGIAAVVAEVANLAHQAPAAQLRIGRDPLLQIRLVRIEAARLRRSRPIDRRLQAVGDVSADGLRILARLPGDRGNGQSLSMKVEYHHELPKSDHRLPPVVPEGAIPGDRSAARSAGTRPGRAGHQTPIRENGSPERSGVLGSGCFRAVNQIRTKGE